MDRRESDFDVKKLYEIGAADFFKEPKKTLGFNSENIRLDSYI